MKKTARNNEQTKFQEKVKNIFINAGFKHLKTDRKPFDFNGDINIELDNLFVYENILIECEDTIYSYELSKKKKKEERTALLGKMKNHKQNKKKAAEIILQRKKEFIGLLKDRFKDFDPNGKYGPDDYKIHFLYFDYMSDEVSEKEMQEYKPLCFISQAIADYFSTISSSIKKSFQYELFRYLNITRQDYLPSEIEGTSKRLISPIVYPERWTGYGDGIRVVTFMMQPKVLLEMACVLRKDSWDGKNDLYQRLITNKRITEVRSFLARENTMFLNNIIVTMPENISFYDEDNNVISIDDITDTKGQYRVDIPLEYNSMAIIDGQHRVYAFFEDHNIDDIEKKIATQREKYCLLVTGIVYPNSPEWTDERKRQFESKIFVDINRNSKQVDADTLILVQSILEPTSREGLSRKVIEDMNKHDPFEKMFKMTKVSKAPISISSIIQYALVFLIDTKINIEKDLKEEYKKTLYYYWLKEEKKDFKYQLSLDDRDRYVKYCSNNLSEYFKAVHSHFFTEWEDPKSKILKVMGINSLVLAYRELLPLTNGPQKAKYYENMMKGWKFHFMDTETEKFNYSGSNYGKLAKEKIFPWFKDHIVEENRN